MRKLIGNRFALLSYCLCVLTNPLHVRVCVYLVFFTNQESTNRVCATSVRAFSPASERNAVRDMIILSITGHRDTHTHVHKPSKRLAMHGE